MNKTKLNNRPTTAKTTKLITFLLLIAIFSSMLTVFPSMIVSASTITTYSASNPNQLLKMSNGQTTPYFTVGEFKCEHCSVSFPVDAKLVDVLHKIRTYFNKPVIITSGYRCSVQNRIDGGVSNSNHLYGRAADIWISGVSMAQIVNYAKTVGAGADTYYVEGSYAHIAVAETSTTTTVNSKNPYPVPTRNLRLTNPMMSGNDVKYLQWGLTTLGFPCGTIDGIFGSLTHNAVISFQRKYQLEVDGIFGPASLSKMRVLLG